MTINTIIGVGGLILIIIAFAIGIYLALNKRPILGIALISFPILYIISFFMVSSIKPGTSTWENYDLRKFDQKSMLMVYRPMKIYDRYIYERFVGNRVIWE